MYRICFIADENAAFAPLRQSLEEQGYEVLEITGLDGALEYVKGSCPDLILLDSAGQQGYQTCETLKNDPDTEVIPVIFMDREANMNGKAVKCLECGANDFISPDQRPEEILARMNAAIRTKQSLSQSKALTDQLNEMNTELYERNLQVEKELYTARQLQQSLLPPFLPEGDESGPDSLQTFEPNTPLRYGKCHYKDENLKISGVYLPCDALGGDIYDVIKFPDGAIGVAIADVSGHGVPAGFITAIFKSSFYRITHNHTLPGDILFHLNNELNDIVKTGEYVTAIYCRIQPTDEGLKMDYTGAGHPYPIYYRASEDRLIRLQENGTPLVWIKNMVYPMGGTTMEPGDKLLFFTDGLSEMRNTQGALYGEEALEELFLKLVRENQPRLLDDLIRHLSDFTEGHPLEDDLSVVLLEVL